MKHYKISIITICFNAENVIEQTILSIIGQTYGNKEYIIIDGQSTDGTLELIKKYDSKISKWISEPDKGIFDAMNKGLNYATGDWVIFMNAGDCFYDKQVLSKIFNNKDYSNKYILYGDTLYLRKNSSNLEIAKKPSYISKNMPTSHQSFFVRLQEAKNLEFDTNLKYVADYKMIYHIYKKYGKKSVAHLNINVSKYEAYLGLTMQKPNEVFHETLAVRNWSPNKLYGYVKYFIKKYCLKKK